MYILPPLTLSSTTTITFPLFTTSLEVAWPTSQVTTLKNGDVSTSSGYDRITETTTLTIPPITTDQIELWNVNVTSGVSSSLIYITSSILPPPFTITDDRNPWTQKGVTHPPQTRTVTPPPFPYTTIPPGPGPRQHPPLTHKYGIPKLHCMFGCGHKCFGLFCHIPCLLDCVPAPPGFNDPDDPSPNPGPGPEPKPQSEPSPSSTSCSKSTVTELWVSCTSINSGSSSCTTTSSSLAVGCDVTASATTTSAASCATSDPDDDGEDGKDPNGPPASHAGSATITPSPTKPAPTAATKTPPTTAASTTASITPPPTKPSPTATSTPSCYLQDEDSSLGINSAYCVCEGSLNYPEPLSTGKCAFTALPSQTINPTALQSVITTDCQVCTVVGTNNGRCTSIPNCVPTTSSTAPPPPTSTTVPPPPASPTPPPVPPQVFNIGYFDECDPSGGDLQGTGSSCASYWTIFTDPSGKSYDPCNDKAVFEDLKAFQPNTPSYPVSEGPFDNGGYKGCKYRQSSSNDAGTMSCSGVLGSCVKDKSGRKECDNSGGTWAPVSVCTFTPGLSK